MNFFSSEKISCPKCLKREDRTGTEHFYHSAITPVFVKAGQAQVLPLPPEFITAQDGSEKQDCERVAAKRWLAQHHQHFDDCSITRLWNGKHGELWQYRFANQVPLRHGSDALQVNWLELVISHEDSGQILYQNSFVTNHKITAQMLSSLPKLDAHAGKSKTRITIP